MRRGMVIDDDGKVPLIEILAPASPEIDRAGIARKLNAAVADVLGARLDAVWTTWRTVDVEVRGDQVAGGSKPIVHVYHHRTREQVERVAEVIELVLARELSIAPADVFVTTQPVSMPDPTLE